MPGHKWTELENRYLRRFYPRGDVNAMAVRLGISKLSVYHHARFLGVKRDPEMVLEKNRQLGKALAAKDLGQRFSKGHVSHNKGRKLAEWMSPEGMRASGVGTFKKGNVPGNRVPIGYERISKEGYVEIKVADGKCNDNFVFKQRMIWEQHHGPVPEGCIIEFIDGDKLNFDPVNLRCVTRAENAARNIEEYHALPPEVKTNIRLLTKLKKTIGNGKQTD